MKQLKYLENILSVLEEPKYFLTAVIATLLVGLFYSFLYGIISIPFLEVSILRKVEIQLSDVLFIVFSSILVGLSITLLKYSQTKKNIVGKVFPVAGLAGGVFGTVCPACLAINVLLFGSIVASFPLAFVVPYLGLIQVIVVSVLFASLWFNARNVCCKVGNKTALNVSWLEDFTKPLYKHVLYLLIIFSAVLLIYQLIPIAGVGSTTIGSTNVNLDEITSQVLPEKGFTIDAKWGDSISKMVKTGVLDVDKLDDTLTKRYGQPLTQEQRALLTSDYSNEKLTINAKNSVFMMYVLWALAKHDDNQILHDSPFAQYFQDYDIGVGKAGYGDTKLISLTSDQQEIAKYTALNSYRPCCNNPTGWPDCSHGFSALGLVELMASQGYSKQEIFDAVVKFNSFWFPSTYIQNAIYFKLKENKNWNQVDMETVAGKDFSSLSGSVNVKNQLKNLGI